MRKPAGVFWMTLLLCGAPLAGFVWMERARIGANPLDRALTLNYPVYAVLDNQNHVYTIDNSMRRIVRTDPEGRLVYTIDGGSRETGSFFYAADILPCPKGKLYVLNRVLDSHGMFAEREDIMQFDSRGRFERTLYSRDYTAGPRDSTLVQRGRIFDLELRDQRLCWYEVEAAGVRLFECDLDTGRHAAADLFPLPDAHRVIADLAMIDRDRFYACHKNGRILRCSRGAEPDVVYRAQDPAHADRLTVPWEIAADRTGNLFFVDLARREIRSIAPDGAIRTVISRDILQKAGHDVDEFDYYRLSVTPDGRIATCNDLAAVAVQASDTRVLAVCDAAAHPTADIVRSWAVYVALLLLAAGILLLLHHAYVHFFQRRLPGILLKGIAIVFVMSLAAVVISTIIVRNFSARYQSLVLEKISQMIQIIPSTIDADRLERVVQPEDYLDADYQAVRSQFVRAFNNNKDPWNSGYYFAVYKVIDHRLFASMYLNDGVGLYYPFNWLDDPEDLYARALNGEIAAKVTSDISGDWIYGVGPIRNSRGQVVALFETGTDMYTFTMENRRLVKGIIVDVATMLVILILVMIELTYYADQRSRLAAMAGGTEATGASRHSPVFLVRTLSFAYFTAVSMALAFIPLVMKSMYQPVPGLSESLVLALPLSVEMFFFGIFNVLAGFLAQRKGVKRVLYAGLIVTAAGLLGSGLAGNMAVFLVARAMTGIGGGLTYIGMRSLISMESDPAVKDEAFSNFYAGMTAGVNVGVIFGAAIADRFGFPVVFFVAVGIVAITMLFQFGVISEAVRALVTAAGTAADRKVARSVGTLKFFFNPRVLGFFVLNIIPTYLVGMFLLYYFPIFAEEQGVSTGDIGRCFILNGLLIVYLGPVLSRWMLRWAGSRNTMLIAGALWSLALLIFAVTGSVQGAILTLVAMGIVEGFGATAQNSYFLSLDAVRKFGEDEAIGCFELVGKAGETIGPMAFGLAMMLGPRQGTYAVSLLGIVAMLLLSVTTLGRKPGQKQQAVANGRLQRARGPTEH